MSLNIPGHHSGTQEPLGAGAVQGSRGSPDLQGDGHLGFSPVRLLLGSGPHICQRCTCVVLSQHRVLLQPQETGTLQMRRAGRCWGAVVNGPHPGPQNRSLLGNLLLVTPDLPPAGRHPPGLRTQTPPHAGGSPGLSGAWVGYGPPSAREGRSPLSRQGSRPHRCTNKPR